MYGSNTVFMNYTAIESKFRSHFEIYICVYFVFMYFISSWDIHMYNVYMQVTSFNHK